MRLGTSTRRRMCAAMVVMLLCVQWLTAAYACPGRAQALVGETPVALAAPDGCHDDMAQERGSKSTALCKAHCEAGQSAPASAATDLAGAPPAATFAVSALRALACDSATAESFAAPWPAAPPGWPPLYLTNGVQRN